MEGPYQGQRFTELGEWSLDTECSHFTQLSRPRH